MGGLHLCGCKDTKKIWIGQILAKESAEKVDFAVKIRKNSQLNAASWGKIVGKDSLICLFNADKIKKTRISFIAYPLIEVLGYDLIITRKTDPCLHRKSGMSNLPGVH